MNSFTKTMYGLALLSVPCMVSWFIFAEIAGYDLDKIMTVNFSIGGIGILLAFIGMIPLVYSLFKNR